MPVEKPPLPAKMFDPFPRIDVDTSDGSPFARILHISLFAANAWMLGPDGPFVKPTTPAQAVHAEVSEALLHLLELGLIDIDTDRLQAARGIPTRRTTLVSPEASEQPEPDGAHRA
jgi:hypothetical protein